MQLAGRTTLSAALTAVLALGPAAAGAVTTDIDDSQPPEIVDVTIDKPVLMPGETGTYTVRFTDENPLSESEYINWSPQTLPLWSEVTSEKLHGGNIIPGSLSTDANGVTSYQLQFRILDNAPYGHYDDSSSMVVPDARGNYTDVAAPPFEVDDPLHPIDNEPVITGDRTVGQDLSGSISAPGASLEYQWILALGSTPQLVSTAETVAVLPQFSGGNLEFRATATWPDGKQLTRRSFSGYIQPQLVDLGRVTFSEPPAVGTRSQAIFTPNPELPFELPWFEVQVESVADLIIEDASFIPFPQDEGLPIRANLNYELPTGYQALSTPEASAVVDPGTWQTGPPTISGNAVTGSELTVNNGTWSGDPQDFQYQWFRNGMAIPMAVFPKHQLTSADVGAKISVRTTAFWPNASPTFSAVSTPVLVRKAALPKIKVELGGTAKVGKKLKASVTGHYDGTKLGYQWLRNGKAISMATKSTYETTAADRATTVSVKVTATRAGYASSTATSAGKSVAAGTLAKATIKITGTPKVGKTLKSIHSGGTKGSKLKYQWLRNGQKIKSATQSTYRLTSADRSTKVSVKVSASKPGFKNTSITSGSKRIGYGTLSKGNVKTSGTPKAGRTLSAQTNGWTAGSKLSYQWLRNGNKIKGATKSTYTLTAKDRKTKISLKVRATKKGYATTPYVSSARRTVK